MINHRIFQCSAADNKAHREMQSSYPLNKKSTLGHFFTEYGKIHILSWVSLNKNSEYEQEIP